MSLSGGTGYSKENFSDDYKQMERYSLIERVIDYFTCSKKSKEIKKKIDLSYKLKDKYRLPIN